LRRALPLLLLLAACTASESTSSTDEDIGRTSEAIVNGSDSTDSQNSVVLILHLDDVTSGGTTTVEGCSGTLLAPNLVLTARHCVSDTDEGVICDENGNALSGGKVISDYDPKSIFVFGGKTRPNFRSKTLVYAQATTVLNTGASTICNNDLALIVLNQELAGTAISPVRLSGGPQKSESVTAVGWGISTTAEQPDTRQQRQVTISDVGPSNTTGLGPSEVDTGEGACSGDSGGPLFSATGAVIAALSRGGNGSNTAGAAGCLNALNIYTSVAEHADLINAGYARVNATPFLEGQSSPGVGTPTSGAPTETVVTTHHGCSSSGSGFNASEIVFSLAVIFCCRRRRNPAISRK
jgi:hypothetical protein